MWGKEELREDESRGRAFYPSFDLPLYVAALSYMRMYVILCWKRAVATEVLYEAARCNLVKADVCFEFELFFHLSFIPTLHQPLVNSANLFIVQ